MQDTTVLKSLIESQEELIGLYRTKHAEQAEEIQRLGKLVADQMNVKHPACGACVVRAEHEKLTAQNQRLRNATPSVMKLQSELEEARERIALLEVEKAEAIHDVRAYCAEASRLEDALAKATIDKDESNACPFCGSEDTTVTQVGHSHWAIECNVCEARGPLVNTSDHRAAISEWEKRKLDAEGRACPFCGNEVIQFSRLNSSHFSYRCEECGARGPVTQGSYTIGSVDKALDAWTKRQNTTHK